MGQTKEKIWITALELFAQNVYDGFLKSNGVSSGIQSYGTVVDLLLAYHYDSQS